MNYYCVFRGGGGGVYTLVEWLGVYGVAEIVSTIGMSYGNI